MNIRKLRYRLRKSLAQRGVRATAATALKKILRPPAKSSEVPKEYSAVHPFDRQFGVDTSSLIFPEDLPSGRGKDLYNTGYFGVAPSVFRQILRRLAPDYEKYTFIDLGSGKGRALLLASEFPFQAIVGVELSPKLHGIAVANFACYRAPDQKCRNLCSIEADATEFTFPDGPLLVYLWNPFEAPVFTRVLANLEGELTRRPRDAYIVYVQPNLETLLDASNCWHKVWRDDFALSNEDYAAHAFPTPTESCSVYRAVFPCAG